MSDLSDDLQRRERAAQTIVSDSFGVSPEDADASLEFSILPEGFHRVNLSGHGRLASDGAKARTLEREWLRRGLEANMPTDTQNPNPYRDYMPCTIHRA